MILLNSITISSDKARYSELNFKVQPEHLPQLAPIPTEQNH